MIAFYSHIGLGAGKSWWREVGGVKLTFGLKSIRLHSTETIIEMEPRMLSREQGRERA